MQLTAPCCFVTCIHNKIRSNSNKLSGLDSFFKLKLQYSTSSSTCHKTKHIIHHTLPMHLARLSSTIKPSFGSAMCHLTLCFMLLSQKEAFCQILSDPSTHFYTDLLIILRHSLRNCVTSVVSLWCWAQAWKLGLLV